jgi:hypothetical protein
MPIYDSWPAKQGSLTITSPQMHLCPKCGVWYGYHDSHTCWKPDPVEDPVTAFDYIHNQALINSINRLADSIDKLCKLLEDKGA